MPVANGGQSTVGALVAATGGRVIDYTVSGPLGTPVQAFFGLIVDGRTAVIEMAAASGLALVSPAERAPLRIGTAGVGELILAGLDADARRFITGIGGSATNDGGAGLAQALGARLLDAQGEAIGPGGGALAALTRIDTECLDVRLQDCQFEVACDLDNPLIGPTGASAVFGPQKGATPSMVRQLDTNLQHYADVLQRDLGVRLHDLPGGGAAVGLGAAPVAYLGAQLRPGVQIVGQALGLDALVAEADLVITGEGRLDCQSLHGKTPRPRGAGGAATRQTGDRHCRLPAQRRLAAAWPWHRGDVRGGASCLHAGASPDRGRQQRAYRRAQRRCGAAGGPGVGASACS